MKKFLLIFTLLFSVIYLSAETKYITLSGYLTLSGTFYVPSKDSYVSGYVNGSVTLRDSSGNYHTNLIYVNSHVGFWASNNYIHTYTYPHECFSVYNKEGKYVGSGCLNESIGLSGWLNGNTVRLSGSSFITLSVTVNE